MVSASKTANIGGVNVTVDWLSAVPRAPTPTSTKSTGTTGNTTSTSHVQPAQPHRSHAQWLRHPRNNQRPRLRARRPRQPLGTVGALTSSRVPARQRPHKMRPILGDFDQFCDDGGTSTGTDAANLAARSPPEPPHCNNWQLRPVPTRSRCRNRRFVSFEPAQHRDGPSSDRERPVSQNPVIAVVRDRASWNSGPRSPQL